MFGWFYERLGRAVIGQIEVWLQEPENIKELTKLTDALVDRQMQRVYAKFNKVKVVPNQAPQGFGLQDLITPSGGLSAKNMIGLFLQKYLGGGGEGSTSDLP